MTVHEVGALTQKKDIVQIRNPKTDRYVKVDRGAAKILNEKKSPGPYANIPIVTSRSGDRLQ